ncbi:hypothetical protein VFPPC_17770 [Pochonia chlamydosporia 170]|uniref:Uncharacterized protein n=1 Tax=Pochonia chlamydosporia 170 TaxID=1380566 RepID=A0A219ARZ6_METCM|nr:hypothetical protein VFPPC_17770 [Pochonia chlamydosporia 170]OWT43054.1 hypothetical protein VFPPC_17770 [Pochonia chlamydosporia 170]
MDCSERGGTGLTHLPRSGSGYLSIHDLQDAMSAVVPPQTTIDNDGSSLDHLQLVSSFTDQHVHGYMLLCKTLSIASLKGLPGAVWSGKNVLGVGVVRRF